MESENDYPIIRLYISFKGVEFFTVISIKRSFVLKIENEVFFDLFFVKNL